MKYSLYDFSFIGDEQYRCILTADYKEAINCMENESYKSVVVLCGSIIESILSDYRFQSDSEINYEKVLKYDLSKLIDYAVEKGLIQERSSQLSHVIRNFRNLIHPGRLIRVKESVDRNLAVAAFGVMNIILEDIRKSYGELFSYNAEELVNILTSDTDTIVNVENYYNKTNKSEIVKIFIKLIEIMKDRESDHSLSLFSVTRIFDAFIKIHDEKDKIYRIGAIELYKETVAGNELAVINLFKVFGSKLNMIKADHKNSILKYVYNKACIDPLFQVAYPYVHKGIYKNLGLYHFNDIEKKLYYQTLINMIEWFDFNHEDEVKNTLSFYKEFTKSLNDEEKNKLKDYLMNKATADKVNKFYYTLDPSSIIKVDDDDLPF